MWRTSSLRVLKNPRPLVMAHRGNSADVPENTRAAFEDAAKLEGVDVIETDAHLTRDGHFVFFHDHVVDRTTDGRGRIKDKTLTELKALDAGYNHAAPDGAFPFRGKGLTIQTVDEILAAFPDQRFNIDIKSKDPRAPALLARKLESLGIENGPGSRVLVASFWDEQIKRFREASSIPTSASTMEVVGFLWGVGKWGRRHGKRGVPERIEHEAVFGRKLPYVALQVPEKLSIIKVVSGKRFVDVVHALGIAVEVWTINEPDVMRRLLGWGVDGVFSDRPGVLVSVMDELFPKPAP
ncbi:MAG: glycerophosphodiester phosphodiesterase [Candidatus Lokiarchaeota archaeon]|nr:glycerophosphodiester phosphodiesterase [Candidatus Lokiarchaeota archaeon]